MTRRPLRDARGGGGGRPGSTALDAASSHSADEAARAVSNATAEALPVVCFHAFVEPPCAALARLVNRPQPLFA